MSENEEESGATTAATIQMDEVEREEEEREGDAAILAPEEEQEQEQEQEQQEQEEEHSFLPGGGDGAVPQALAGEERSCWARTKARVGSVVQEYPDLVGFCLNAVATLAFSVMNVLVKLGGSASLGPFEMVFFRNVMQLTLGSINTIAASRADRNPLGRFDRRLTPMLLARGVIGICAMTCNFFALQMMQIEEATIVSFLQPVLTALIGFIFLKEKLTKLEIFGMPFSLVGIILVSAPPSILSWFGFGPESTFSSSSSGSSSDGSISMSTSLFETNSSTSSMSSTSGLQSESLYWGVLTPVWRRTVGALFGVLGCVGSATAYVMTRKIGKAVHHTVIINWLSLCGVVLPILPMLLLEGFKVPHGTTWLYVAFVGVVAFVAQTFLTTALRTGVAGRVAIANYIGIIWAFMWGVLIFHEPPHVLSYVGSLFIGVNAAISIYKAWFIGHHSADTKHVELHNMAADSDGHDHDEHDEHEHDHAAPILRQLETPGLDKGVTPILP